MDRVGGALRPRPPTPPYVLGCIRSRRAALSSTASSPRREPVMCRRPSVGFCNGHLRCSGRMSLTAKQGRKAKSVRFLKTAHQINQRRKTKNGTLRRRSSSRNYRRNGIRHSAWRHKVNSQADILGSLPTKAASSEEIHDFRQGRVVRP